MYLTGLLCVFVGSDFFKGILMACSADSLSCCKNIFYVAKKIELTARFRRRRLFFCYCNGAWRAKSPFASRAAQRTLLLLYCRPPTRSCRHRGTHCSIVRRRWWRGHCTVHRLPRTQCFLFSVSIETRKQKHYIICIETESKKSFSITSVFFLLLISHRNFVQRYVILLLIEPIIYSRYQIDCFFCASFLT